MMTAIWIDNSLSDYDLEENVICVGWQVSREIYGDSRTHFFTYWTRDAHRTTGCFNMNYPGFKLTDRSIIAPGSIMNLLSGVDGAREKIMIKVFRKSTGDWWIHYGFNNAPTAMGCYPENLFTKLSEEVTSIAFGGNAIERDGSLSSPMDSGFLPSILYNKAASIEDITFVDKYGKIAPFMWIQSKERL